MPEYIYPLQHFLYYYVYGPPPKITYHIRFHYMARNDHHHQKFPALFSKTNKSQKKKCLKSCSTKLLFLWCLLNELCSFPWFRSPTPDKGCSFQGQCTVAKNGQKCRITRQFQRMTKKKSWKMTDLWYNFVWFLQTLYAYWKLRWWSKSLQSKEHWLIEKSFICIFDRGVEVEL